MRRQDTKILHLRAALAITIAISITIGPIVERDAFADVDRNSVGSNPDDSANVDDLNTQMRNILNTPVDFCDPVAMAAQQNEYDKVYDKKFELERQREKMHPTLKQLANKVASDLADEGLLDDPPQIVEDYEAAIKRGDNAAANILLNKMTPWEQERAAESQHNYSLTTHLLMAMADQDDVKAQRRLAQLYSWTTDFDMVALAKYQASIHQISTAPPRDDALAFKYARLASQNGDEMAQEILAKAYACGRGTEKNLVDAYAWFSLALSQSALTLETDEQPEFILRKRTYLAGEMSHADVQSAKHLLMRCYKGHYKDCD